MLSERKSTLLLLKKIQKSGKSWGIHFDRITPYQYTNQLNVQIWAGRGTLVTVAWSAEEEEKEDVEKEEKKKKKK